MPQPCGGRVLTFGTTFVTLRPWKRTLSALNSRQRPGGPKAISYQLAWTPSCAAFEVTSEEAGSPLENALSPDQKKWIAATPGEQTFLIKNDLDEQARGVRA